MQDAKNRQKSPSAHHRTTLSGYIFATKARIDNRNNLVKQQYLLQMSPQYGELRLTSFIWKTENHRWQRSNCKVVNYFYGS